MLCYNFMPTYQGVALLNTEWLTGQNPIVYLRLQKINCVTCIGFLNTCPADSLAHGQKFKWRLVNYQW